MTSETNNGQNQVPYQPGAQPAPNQGRPPYETMFCTTCGKQIAKAALQCPFCGAPVNPNINNQNRIPTGTVQSGYYQPVYVQPVQKKKKKWPWVIVGILSFIIIVGVFGNNSSKTEDVTTKNKESRTVTEAAIDKNSGKSEFGTTKSNDTAETTEITYDTVDYQDVARNPQNYKGHYISFNGRIIQVLENTFLGKTTVTLRINEDGKLGDNTWYVTYTRSDNNESRLLEDDYVTVYGICDGVKSYQALLGNQITIPSIKADTIVLGKVVGDMMVVFDADAIISGLKVNEYKLTSTYSRYYFLEIENTSVYDINLTVNIKYYDSKDTLIGVDKEEENIQAGGTVLVYDMPDDEYSYTKIEYEVSNKTSSVPMQSEFSYEVIQKTDKLIVTVKNNAEYTASFVEAHVLFFNGDTLVDHGSSYITDSDYEIKAGKECSDEINFYNSKNTFDNYKIYIAGRRK